MSIDLTDLLYKEDFNPISTSCGCYACRHHTRGYVNHLLATKELLSSVLLTMHNVWCYSKFFERVRECVATKGKLGRLKKAIEAAVADVDHNGSPKKRKTAADV